MKIKTKLRLGFSLLFIIILILGALSAYYLNKLSADAKLVLQDNYESLQYSRIMLNVLDNENLYAEQKLMHRFGEQLLKQEQNITEPGESNLTANLRYNFELLKKENRKHITETYKLE